MVFPTFALHLFAIGVIAAFQDKYSAVDVYGSVKHTESILDDRTEEDRISAKEDDSLSPGDEKLLNELIEALSEPMRAEESSNDNKHFEDKLNVQPKTTSIDKLEIHNKKGKQTISQRMHKNGSDVTNEMTLIPDISDNLGDDTTQIKGFTTETKKAENDSTPETKQTAENASTPETKPTAEDDFAPEEKDKDKDVSFPRIKEKREDDTVPRTSETAEDDAVPRTSETAEDDTVPRKSETAEDDSVPDTKGNSKGGSNPEKQETYNYDIPDESSEDSNDNPSDEREGNYDEDLPNMPVERDDDDSTEEMDENDSTTNPDEFDAPSEEQDTNQYPLNANDLLNKRSHRNKNQDMLYDMDKYTSPNRFPQPVKNKPSYYNSEYDDE